jgi:hypothetical protein
MLNKRLQNRSRRLQWFDRMMLPLSLIPGAEDGPEGVLGAHVGKGRRCTTGYKLLGSHAAGADADTFGSNGLGGGDIAPGVSDHHHAAAIKGLAELLRSSPGPDPQQLSSIFIIRAKAAKGEVAIEATMGKLDLGPALDVARS